jgi:hypothetical protein
MIPEAEFIPPQVCCFDSTLSKILLELFSKLEGISCGSVRTPSGEGALNEISGATPTFEPSDSVETVSDVSFELSPGVKPEDPLL